MPTITTIWREPRSLPGGHEPSPRRDETLREAKQSRSLKQATCRVGRALESQASETELNTIRSEFLIRDAQ